MGCGRGGNMAVAEQPVASGIIKMLYKYLQK
jgi:hypothetical protein